MSDEEITAFLENARDKLSIILEMQNKMLAELGLTRNSSKDLKDRQLEQ